jgi:hypothetical protein
MVKYMMKHMVKCMMKCTVKNIVKNMVKYGETLGSLVLSGPLGLLVCYECTLETKRVLVK